MKLRTSMTVIGLGAGLVAGKVGLHRWAESIRRSSRPDLDDLYDLPPDVASRDLPAVDGGTIHLVERGEGRPLVLVHGVTLQSGIWAPQLHQMASRWRVIALDVRGHGRSDPGSDGFGRVAAARDLATVLEALDLHDAVIVGHSMGGMILMEFAGDHTEVLAERVAGLVFMDTAAYQILPPLVLPVAKLLGKRVVSRVEAGRSLPIRPMGEDDLSIILTRLAFGARPSGRAVEQTRRYGADMAEEASIPLWVDLLDHDAREALKATRTPSLVLVGSRDLLTPVWAARRIARFLPGSRLEVIPGAGHQLMQERPAEVAALIEEFAADLPPAGQRDGSENFSNAHQGSPS